MSGGTGSMGGNMGGGTGNAGGSNETESEREDSILRLNEDMRLAWLNHVYWTRMYLMSAVADNADQQAVEERLLETADEITDVFARYLPIATTRQLRNLLTEHIEIGGQIIQALKASGITIIYISHRLDELYEVSDRVTVMRDGCYITTTDTADVTKDQLIAYMVGRELKKDFAERNSRTEEVLLETKNLGGNGVEPFSIKLHKGEVLGFGGLVGAGRTEYAQLIFGAAPKECGSIYLNGQKIEINSPEDAVKYGIGMVPEDRKQCGALLRMSIRENIVVSILKRISNRFSFVDRSQEKKIADEQMNALRIKAPSADVLVNNLSGGNQQKVVLAKWLANNSQVLILDEPTRGIDVGAKQEIYKLIDELAAQGKGIIVISSDMEEIMGITDRMLILYEGTLKGELQRAEYQQERILKHASGEN